MQTQPPDTAAPKRARKKPPAGARTPPANEPPTAAGVNLASIHGSLGYHLRRAQVAQFQAFAAVFAPFEIRPVQFAMLAILHDNPGIKQTQLGEALSIKRANQVALIDELEQRGLVERRHRADDRRSHALHLTGAGKKMARKLLEVHAQHELGIAERLGTKQRDQLLGLLKAYLRAAGTPGFAEFEQETR